MTSHYRKKAMESRYALVVRTFCGSGDRRFYVIDLESMTLALKLDAHARLYSSPLLIGEIVISGDNGGVVREIDPVSLEIVGKLRLPDAVTNALAFTPDGTRVFVLNEIYAF
jgi:hypothetical protein